MKYNENMSDDENATEAIVEEYEKNLIENAKDVHVHSTKLIYEKGRNADSALTHMAKVNAIIRMKK